MRRLHGAAHRTGVLPGELERISVYLRFPKTLKESFIETNKVEKKSFFGVVGFMSI